MALSPDEWGYTLTDTKLCWVYHSNGRIACNRTCCVWVYRPGCDTTMRVFCATCFLKGMWQ